MYSAVEPPVTIKELGPYLPHCTFWRKDMSENLSVFANNSRYSVSICMCIWALFPSRQQFVTSCTNSFGSLIFSGRILPTQTRNKQPTLNWLCVIIIDHLYEHTIYAKPLPSRVIMYPLPVTFSRHSWITVCFLYQDNDLTILCHTIIRNNRTEM